MYWNLTSKQSSVKLTNNYRLESAEVKVYLGGQAIFPAKWISSVTFLFNRYPIRVRGKGWNSLRRFKAWSRHWHHTTSFSFQFNHCKYNSMWLLLNSAFPLNPLLGWSFPKYTKNSTGPWKSKFKTTMMRHNYIQGTTKLQVFIQLPTEVWLRICRWSI